MSMIGQQMINNINLNLQLAKQNTLPFGGITILFSGDFLQHQPVCAKPLYYRTDLENALNQTTSQYNIEINAGRLLWINLTHVIFLEENIRQKLDPAYAALLSRLRSGNHTQDTLLSDYNLLSSRLIEPNTDIIGDWSAVGVCVSRNSLRQQINTLKLNSISTKLKNHYLLFLRLMK
jgi:hypothetical protein